MPKTPESISARKSMRETVASLSRARLEVENEHLRSSLSEMRQQHEKIRLHHARLEEENKLLRSPELHEARFIELDAGHSKVVFRGGTRLVKVACDHPVEDLKPGQAVYLNREMNVIVDISTSDGPAFGEIATVERNTTDGRLVVRSRGEELLVRLGHKLADASPMQGDELVIDRDLRMALEPVMKDQANSWEYADIVETPPEALGGYDAVRDQVINRFTRALMHPDLAREYRVNPNPSLLIEGPPGTGKTLTMRVIATVMTRHAGKTCRVASVKASELEDSFVGNTQKNIKKLFTDLRSADGPRMLFIDEVEAIARRRGNFNGFHADRFLSSWLTEMEGLAGDVGVATIATTNRRDLLDQAFADRFDFTIRMGRPRMSAAADIFAIHLDESFPYATNGVDQAQTRKRVIDAGVAKFFAPNADNELAVLRFRDGKPRTVLARELISGRLIEQCCEATRELAFQRAADGGAPGICVNDLEQAVDQKIEQLSTVLTIGNVHHYLTDLPTDVDVVSVDPVRRPSGNNRRYVGGTGP